MTIAPPTFNIAADVRRAKRELSRLGQLFPDKEFAYAVGARVERIIDDNFRQEGNDQGPWKALKAETLNRRRGGAGQILQDTGRLKSGFETARIISNKIVEIGPASNIVYAGTHQYGDASRNIPARPMLPSQEYAEAQMVKMLDALVEAKRRKAGA